ncbi:carboxypeptidase-like regulatory domain-containing protein [Chitinophaga sp. XS-30]|uniref:carboxypeptidase-like regulatory domain-containing protein n=1 Tax=Chitinophaga sp. XS-30 TaxID=2604421 RepID=UPI0011DD14F5|nr:carboxypeptidase-like regulatory domain-containing protein [Chitinophaga sp. XS-30]QEH42976.1 hypothetical protein FW415_19720 [Chitinophaga sp. XS-30]
MKQLHLLAPLCLLVLITCFSCNKTGGAGPDGGPDPEYVTATISGRITDDAAKPVAGAVVVAGDDSTITDVDGAFTISNVTLSREAAFVKVKKNGFFMGTKTFVISANKNNPVAIRLIRKRLAGTISGSGGGTVMVPSQGGTINFEANSIVDPVSNAAYTGAVAVSAFFIDPEAADFRDIMPGALRGITANDEETGLQSFGMMAVELTGAAGEQLQLAPGKKATLHFPIPSKLQAEAPATIPLWSLDETTGLWKEEGQATREGTEYVGAVSHFSFWNCDAPFSIVDFTGIIRNQAGDNMEKVEVVISVPSGNDTSGSISGHDFTNAEGVIKGKFPANRIMKLNIYDKCRALIHAQNIGPFTASADLGVITVNYSPSQVAFSGTVKNCADTPLAQGFVTVALEGMYYNIPVENGNFNATITRCGSGPTTATLTAYDIDGRQSGPKVERSVAGVTVDAGVLAACGTPIDTYIKYSLNGVEYEILPPADTVFFSRPSQNSSITAIGGRWGRNQYENIIFLFTGEQAPGTYPVFLVDIYSDEGRLLYVREGNFTTTLSEYGTTPGSYITGTFAGMLRDSLTSNTIPINCSFRVIR